MGKAIAQVERLLVWMEQLSQEGAISSNEFFTVMERSYKHESGVCKLSSEQVTGSLPSKNSLPADHLRNKDLTEYTTSKFKE